MKQKYVFFLLSCKCIITNKKSFSVYAISCCRTSLRLFMNSVEKCNITKNSLCECTMMVDNIQILGMKYLRAVWHLQSGIVTHKKHKNNYLYKSSEHQQI